MGAIDEMNALGEMEMDCLDVRAALHERHTDALVEAHIDGCQECGGEQRAIAAVRSALVVQAPPELSARLLALAAPAPQPVRLDLAMKRAMVLEAPPDLSAKLQQLAISPTLQPAPRRWAMPVYAATLVLLGVVLMVAGQVYGLALQELGIGAIWRGVAELPGQWLNQLYDYFPQGRYVVDAFFSLQRALQWVLIGVLMWAVLEMRSRRGGGYPSTAIRA